jgi:hypothetical protein
MTMGLNFQQVTEKIKKIGMEVRAYQEDLGILRGQGRDLLETWADKGRDLRNKVERASRADPNIRCAIPLDERMDASVPESSQQEPFTIVAADGSQILADRHSSVQFSLVNVGAIALQPGSGLSPEVFTDSSLLFADELYTDTGMVSAEAIEQRRDIAERRKLLDLAPNYPYPLVALTDGPVELWGAKNSGEDDYRKNLETHKSILSQLQDKKVITAGYVDKPGANLVVRTLEIACLPGEADYINIRKQHPLRGVTDRWLFNFLPSGHRSAVFGLQSSSRQYYTGDLALCFFYLNVGEDKFHALVRVEFPKWVAEDAGRLDLLHTTLLQQCRVMGVKPYPYILHRAHEIAVVNVQEKKQIEQMLALELRRAGVEMEDESNKQSAKNLPGRGKK